MADIVWQALGDVRQYVEPFAGSLAVLLGRPEWHEGTCETVNDADLYAVDDHHISIEVRDWAIANGDNPRYRIVLAGYFAEHAEIMPDTWRLHRYSASKSYGTTASVGHKKGNDANRHNECLWYSPHCLNPQAERSLFA